MSDGVYPTTGGASGPDVEPPDRAVGLVAGTEDSTPLQFRVALAEDAYLQLDDVVVTVAEVPGVGPVTHGRGRHRGRGPARGRHASAPTSS